MWFSSCATSAICESMEAYDAEAHRSAWERGRAARAAKRRERRKSGAGIGEQTDARR
jgi:hypothetical protein